MRISASQIAKRCSYMRGFAVAVCILSFHNFITAAVAAPRSKPLSSGSKGAPWAILCLELTGRTRHADIEQFAETLKRTPGIRPGEIFIHDESDGFSRLYYGKYYRKADAKTGKRLIPADMRKDLDLLRELAGPKGERYFLQSLPVRMPQGDVGNPEWALARANGVYTLQVAAFEPTDDFAEFKQAAADYCEVLRKKGYQAYYHHTPTLSMVTVGSFGEEVLYVGADKRNYYTEEVSRLQNDELLRYNVVNGAIVKVRDDKGKWVAIASRLVHIPRKAEVPTNVTP